MILRIVRIDPVLIELEKEQEDLLIIGHASVIRCMLSYLIGLPASEIPAIEIARGDLLEVIPASYGVQSQAFHFWDGPGRTGKDPMNFYENYAEDTKGKRNSIMESIEMMNRQMDVFEDVGLVEGKEVEGIEGKLPEVPVVHVVDISAEEMKAPGA
jgi:hypothetical protein